MTLEEAIKMLSYLRPGCGPKPICTEGEECEALDLALSALRGPAREQVEKVWRGEWQYHPEDYDDLTWTCARCGEAWTLIDGTPDDNNMNFCPACGAPMTDEAVDMVMERWETLYGKS